MRPWIQTFTTTVVSVRGVERNISQHAKYADQITVAMIPDQSCRRGGPPSSAWVYALKRFSKDRLRGMRPTIPIPAA